MSWKDVSKEVAGPSTRSSELALLERIRGFQKSEAENRRCIVCGEIGASYVCMNFGTFVCTPCSGIHREFSHKVKGVSVSKWTPEEVDFIESHGNMVARKIYFHKWNKHALPPPEPGNVEKIRKFIRAVFVENSYLSESRRENYAKNAKIKMSKYHKHHEKHKTTDAKKKHVHSPQKRVDRKSSFYSTSSTSSQSSIRSPYTLDTSPKRKAHVSSSVSQTSSSSSKSYTKTKGRKKIKETVQTTKSMIQDLSDDAAEKYSSPKRKTKQKPLAKQGFSIFEEFSQNDPFVSAESWPPHRPKQWYTSQPPVLSTYSTQQYRPSSYTHNIQQQQQQPFGNLLVDYAQKSPRTTIQHTMNTPATQYMLGAQYDLPKKDDITHMGGTANIFAGKSSAVQPIESQIWPKGTYTKSEGTTGVFPFESHKPILPHTYLPDVSIMTDTQRRQYEELQRQQQMLNIKMEHLAKAVSLNATGREANPSSNPLDTTTYKYVDNTHSGTTRYNNPVKEISPLTQNVTRQEEREPVQIGKDENTLFSRNKPIHNQSIIPETDSLF